MRYVYLKCCALLILCTGGLSVYGAPDVQTGCGFSFKRMGGPHDAFPRFNNFNSAMTSALTWLRAKGFKDTLANGWSAGKLSSRHTGSASLSSFEGIGPNGEVVKLRIEIHPIRELGGETVAHINVQFGKEKGPHFIFPGNAQSVEAILRQLGPTLGKSPAP